MNKFFRALIAGYGAKKLGGGCFSTILIFIIIYWALGTCNSSRSIQHTYQSAPTQTFAGIVPIHHTTYCFQWN